MNRFTLVVNLLYGALLAGCAQFHHQTTELEPHGLIKVVKDLDSRSAHGEVERIDGLPVSAGREYRVKQGEHTVVVLFVETSVQSYSPYRVGSPDISPSTKVNVSHSGTVSVSGSQPYSGMQAVDLTVENRRLRYVTNSILVQAGWRYEIDGDNVTKTQLKP